MHHICIDKHVTIVDGHAVPFGSVAIEEKMTEVVSTMLDDIVPLIGTGEVTVCGDLPARRILGRKIEDRLKREVKYE